MDLNAKVAEQIALGHKAGELLANPAFKQAVDDLAVQYYADFRAASPMAAEDLVLARLRTDALDRVVADLTQMHAVGFSNTQHAKR